MVYIQHHNHHYCGQIHCVSRENCDFFVLARVTVYLMRAAMINSMIKIVCGNVGAYFVVQARILLQLSLKYI